MSDVDRFAGDADVTTNPPRSSVANRRESPILPPDLSDEEVVQRWLRAKATGSGRLATNTLALYRTEAERLFWYASKIGVPISSWTMDEFSGYISFLQDPPAWAIRERGVRRGSPDWRPFLKPLSMRSAGQTQKIVTSLFDWLRDVGYLQFNPAAGLPVVDRMETEKQSRFLSPDDCMLLRETIAARPEKSREDLLTKARDLFAVDLFERTGLRTTEAVSCSMGDVRIARVTPELRREFPDAPEFQWLLRVRRGKGGKSRWVPCDDIALSLQAYRIAFGLPALPAESESLPLLLSVRRTKFGDRKGLRRVAVWNLITSLRDEAAEWARANGRQIDADKFARASTHWLRHTYAKGLAEAIDNGLDERSALRNMGHANRRTFDQYVDDEPLKRAMATQLARRRLP